MSSRSREERGPKVAAPADTLDIALSLAAIGWPVFPVSIYESPTTGKRSKVPAVKWKHEATTDAATIRAWWTGEHRGRWIGVYAGAAGIVVLDGDPGYLKVLRKAGLEIPATFDYPTHRAGGRHHVYAAPDGVELTIAADVTGPDGKPLRSVDVRSGHGLMVYYGPKIEKPPKLAPAPDWLLVPAEKGDRDTFADRAPDATVDAFYARLLPGKPRKKLRRAVDAIDFPTGSAHGYMLEVVTLLVGAGIQGERGIGTLLDETRERYASSGGDRPRDWDNALHGSVKRLGLPRRTLALSPDEKAQLVARNDPDEIEKRDKKKKATFRAEKHAAAIATAGTDERPLPGDRVLEDAALADELARMLGSTWAYSTGFGIMRYVTYTAADAFGPDRKAVAGHWKPAEEHSLIEAVRRLLVEIEVDEHTAAAMRGDNKAIDKARTLLSRARAAAVARLVIGILAELEPAFDAHPDLLNTPSGVVDLRTGDLLSHNPALYLTKITAAPYDPKADMRRWLQVVEAVTPKVADWLQIRFGQAATGYTPGDAVMVIFEGAGSNGKTTFVTAPFMALGDYSTMLPERLLLANPGDHPTTLMSLQGARLGVIEELPEGRQLNVKRLKDSVGTPFITARKMRQDDVTFKTTHALMLNTNYLPIVAETDHGTWRRLALVRFGLKYVETEEELTSKRTRLGDESILAYFEKTADPGVLRWIVEGAVRWYAAGQRFPKKPAKVKADTEAWRLEADPILAYTAERIVVDDGFAITATDLQDDFNQWLERRGHKRWSGQTINSRFQGHVTFDGIERKMVKWSNRVRPSRPANLFSTRPIPKTTTSWKGIRFVEEQRIPSEAELDAATLRDLERRASQ